MKLSFNPSNSNKNILDLIKDNKDIIFDLKGHNIYARGVEFKGIDTWRPVVDNLTSDSTTISLSANQGRILAGLINGKSDSEHNHDDIYLKLTGGSLTGNLTGISAMFSGRFYGSGDDEGIIIKPAPNSFAGLILGTPTGKRSVFYYKSGNAFWRYADGSGIMDIYHPKKSGTIALASDIPTSLKNPYSLTTFGVVYDGSSAKVVSPSNFINQLEEGISIVTDGTMLVTSYASDKGFAYTNAVNVPYKRKAVHLWEYIKGKTDSLYATKSHNHDRRYVYSYGDITMDGASLNKNALGMTTTSGITGDWWHILQAAWNGEYRWNSQIAFPTQNRNGMYYRSGLDDNTAWGSWVKLLDANNYSGVLDSRYYTESEVNSLLSNKLNTSDFNWTNLPGKLVAGNEFNIVNAGFKESIYFNYLPINDRSKAATILGYYFGNGAKGSAPITASGFIKTGSNISYVLLGNGGHKLESALNVANADTVDGYHATDGRTFNGDINWGSWKDNWSDGTNEHPWYGFDHRYPRTGAYSTTLSDFWGMTIKTASTLRLDFGTLLLNGTSIYSIKVASSGKATIADSANKLNKWFDSRVADLNQQFGDGGLRIFHATSSTTANKCPSDAAVLHLAWDNNEGWDSQLAVGPSQNKLYFRGQNNYKWNPWQTVLHDGNSSISGNTIKINNTSLTVASSNHNHDNVYLKLAGGTMNDGSRINVNGNLYIGDSDNGGWLYFQDIASQDGIDYWTISTNGSAEFEDITTRSSISVGGQVYRGGISCNWNKGRDNALLRDTSSRGYHLLWSLKTTSGSWDFGEYNFSGYNNIPMLTYVTDTQHNGSSPSYTHQIRFPLASGTVALTSNIPNPTNYYWANVKVSASSNTQTQPSVNTIYASNWFRSQGASGWYSENYGGGIYMTDSSWVKVFNNKGFYTKNTIKGTTLQVEGTNQTATVANMEPNLLLLGSDTINNKLDTYIRGLGVYIQSRFDGITDNTVHVKNGSVGIGESPSTTESGKGSLTISNFTFMKCGGTMFRQPVCVFIGNFHHQRSSKYLKASNTNIEFSYSNGIYKFIFKFLPSSKFTVEDLFLQVTGYSELFSQQVTDARGYLINGASDYVEAYIGASDDTSYNTASFYFTIYRYYGSSKKTI